MTPDAMRNPSAVWWLVPITALLLFWSLNIVMPINADDFSNSVFVEHGVPKIIRSFSQFMQSA